MIMKKIDLKKIGGIIYLSVAIYLCLVVAVAVYFLIRLFS